MIIKTAWGMSTGISANLSSLSENLSKFFEVRSKFKKFESPEMSKNVRLDFLNDLVLNAT